MNLDQRIRFRDKDMTCYASVEIETFLREHPARFDDNPDKLIVELLVGAILAREGEKRLSVIHRVALMLEDDRCKENHQSHIPLVDIVSRVVRLHEHEVDIYVARDTMEGEVLPDGFTYQMSPIQVTRLCPKREDIPVYTQDLCDLVRKKCRVQPDDYLQLAILIDATFDFDQRMLSNAMKTVTVPYRSIYLITQAGDSPILGQFLIKEIHPDSGLYSEVQLNLGESL